MTKIPQYMRDLVGNLFILLFFIFGHRELKVGERTWLKYSTGLLMHDLLLILTSKLNIMIMHTLKNENYFLVFLYYHSSRRSTK